MWYVGLIFVCSVIFYRPVGYPIWMRFQGHHSPVQGSEHDTLECPMYTCTLGDIINTTDAAVNVPFRLKQSKELTHDSKKKRYECKNKSDYLRFPKCR